MVNRIINWLRRKLNKKQLAKAIKHAQHVRYTTGKKCLVLWVEGTYRVYSMQSIKALAKSKYFKKGTTHRDIERLAVYTTS
ncbi:hypothetical protein ACTJIJ_22955 [Niabella sp. 22666]|uniref:hypothetical protein n=1 Tax=Niabella sp. 22666 TaxID=3453954 RepID=UPI003F84CE6D